MGLGAELQPQRACGNGELVDINRDGARPAKDPMPPAVQGSTTGFGLRDAGVAERPR
jgi:hypothetical protein